jgi:hypothetical protein
LSVSLISCLLVVLGEAYVITNNFHVHTPLKADDICFGRHSTPYDSLVVIFKEYKVSREKDKGLQARRLYIYIYTFRAILDDFINVVISSVILRPSLCFNTQ